MKCARCDKDYNHLMDRGANSHFCSRLCSHLFLKHIMSPEEKVEAIRRLLEDNQCGDSSCLFGRPGGMMTNGGCATQKVNFSELNRVVQRLAFALREIVTYPETEEQAGPRKERKPLQDDGRFAKLDVE